MKSITNGELSIRGNYEGDNFY